MATEINIKNLPHGYQSIISNGKHSIVGDEPVKDKGTDLGFSPTELVLAGLAMCKVATIRYVARKDNLDIGEVNACLSQVAKRKEHGGFHTTVEVSIDIEGDLTDEQRKKLLKQADHCYVHRMLEGEWNIENAKVGLAQISKDPDQT